MIDGCISFTTLVNEEIIHYIFSNKRMLKETKTIQTVSCGASQLMHRTTGRTRLPAKLSQNTKQFTRILIARATNIRIGWQ
jgi:hypothetical protein